MSNLCPECSFEVKDDFNFCPKCNFNLKGVNMINENKIVVKCNSCGEENSLSAVFCSECGIKLSKNPERKSIDSFAGKKKNDVMAKSKSPDVPKTDKNELAIKKISNLQILLIILGVAVAGVIMLAGSGVFSPGNVANPVNHVEPDQQPEGADLNALNHITGLENELKANPNSAEKMVELANVLFDSQLFDRAIMYYGKYLLLKPEDVNARVDLGVCYFKKNEFAPAIEQMEKALKYDPRHVMAHFNLGIVNLNAGNSEKAKFWFKKVIEIEPNSDYAKKAEELLKSQ